MNNYVYCSVKVTPSCRHMELRAYSTQLIFRFSFVIHIRFCIVFIATSLLLLRASCFVVVCFSSLHELYVTLVNLKMSCVKTFCVIIIATFLTFRSSRSDKYVCFQSKGSHGEDIKPLPTNFTVDSQKNIVRFAD